MSKQVFESYKLAGRIVPNRMVAQAMEINCAEVGGAVGNTVLNRYKALAEGGWGIVFLEATSITDQHLARKHGLVLSPKNLDGFKRLVDEFKAVNESTLFMFQLTRSGRQSGEFSRKVKVYEDDQAEIPVLSEKDLDEVRNQFMGAVTLAKQAGADGVDIKACHGYLGGELLRPLNRRKDKYGGAARNRAFLASSIIKQAAEEFPDLIVGSRISAYEGIRGGCGTAGPAEILEDLEDMQKVTSFLVKAGADYLNISSGIPSLTPQITRPAKRGDFYRFSHYRYTKEFKKWFPGTVIIGSTYSTGDMESLAIADENLTKGYTDFVGYGRQNLADPYFPSKIRQGKEAVQFCLLCGKCSKLLKKDTSVFCANHHSTNPYR